MALARALAANPAVLLLDEPFSALDPSLRAEVRDAVVQLLAEGTGPAVIVVTHDVDEAATLAGRLIVLLDGRLAQSGPPSELLAAPRSLAIARFLGLPNLIRGVRDCNGVIRSALGSIHAPGPPGTVTLAARASAIRVSPWSGRGLRATVCGVVERVSGPLVRVTLDGEELLGVPDIALDAAAGIAAVEVDMSAVHVVDEPQRGSA